MTPSRLSQIEILATEAAEKAAEERSGTIKLKPNDDEDEEGVLRRRRQQEI
jgi:hypothetical protein